VLIESGFGRIKSIIFQYDRGDLGDNKVYCLYEDKRGSIVGYVSASYRGCKRFKELKMVFEPHP
jgi:hypothetical protein